MAISQYRQENQRVYILHTYPFKETSLIAELFTEQFGRVAVVAKGARRPRSSIRGMLQSFQVLLANWSGKNELKSLNGLEWCEKLTVLEGNALMCGFYLNELMIRLLPRDEPYTELFHFYHETILALSVGEELTIVLRRFELKLLQALGYAVTLDQDEDSNPIIPDKIYRYEAEYGACDLTRTDHGIKILGKTLLDMSKDFYQDKETQQQSKQLMRYLLGFYLGDKPLHSKQLFVDLQG
ncbi:MAG: DNA repair protein RecO [Candidatus Methylopumilus sp.]|nr:DNA repair protein RecO [Candidatus Methylopumilus sp.]